MIVGHGDIASALEDREDRLYFASGVSNSQELDEAEYQREIHLLLEQPPGDHIVYFSSLSVFEGISRYHEHKRYVEGLIKANFEPYTIVRLGNIDFGKNPHTLINYLRERIATGQPFEIQDVYRYVASEEELLYWVNLIPDWSCELSVPGRRLKVTDIVKEIIEGKL